MVVAQGGEKEGIESWGRVGSYRNMNMALIVLLVLLVVRCPLIRSLEFYFL